MYQVYTLYTHSSRFKQSFSNKNIFFFCFAQYLSCKCNVHNVHYILYTPYSPNYYTYIYYICNVGGAALAGARRVN